MPHYVILMRYHSSGVKRVSDDPEFLREAVSSIERWEAKVHDCYHLLGEWDMCFFVEAPDNFKAYRASLAQEMSTTGHTEILPAIDLPIFKRLMSQNLQTGGPHEWQVKWWARAARTAMHPYAYARWRWKYFKPFTVTGQEKLANIKGPCIVAGNHSSHMDQYALLGALPRRIVSNIYFGAAADRWFLKGRKEWTLQPWYQSLVMGLYPIQRGGGSRTLDYPTWLLDQGCNLMLFPEGTRARGRTLSRFKYGVSILALEKDVPVIPIYLAGLREMRPPGTREIIPGPVTAHILDPLHFAPGTGVPEATQQLFDVMNAAHQQELERKRTLSTTLGSPSPATG